MFITPEELSRKYQSYWVNLSNMRREKWYGYRSYKIGDMMKIEGEFWQRIA